MLRDRNNLDIGLVIGSTTRLKEAAERETNMASLARQFSTDTPSNAAAVPAGVSDRSLLTPRELDVLRLMADGLTTREIGDRLNMRFKTAACHRNRVLQKVGVKSTVSAVRWAIRQGIVEL